MGDKDKMAKKTEAVEVPVKAAEEIKVAEPLKAAVDSEEKIIEEIKEVKEEAGEEIKPVMAVNVSEWTPKTALGRKVKNGEITDIDQILKGGEKINEKEIIDVLLPGVEMDLLLIGQAKGKFGGGKRRAFRQTQKKTSEGNKPKFSTYVVVGDKNGHIGIGYGKAKETVPAREKAIRNAKLNVISIKKGCGSWECNCGTQHSIPFAVSGKCGSVKIKIMPAPKGTGLKIQSECSKMLKLAGISDVWSTATGQTTSRTNLIVACFEALKSISTTKVKKEDYKKLGIKEEE